MDPEQIVGLLPGTKRKLLPLAGNFKYVQASLQLEHLRLVIVQRPPCASEGYLEQDQTGIAFSMADAWIEARWHRAWSTGACHARIDDVAPDLPTQRTDYRGRLHARRAW